MQRRQPALLKQPWTAPVASLGVVLLGVVALWSMGRVWWCDCGTWSPWSWDVWSKHNSQHLIDPYSLSHFLHGLILYGVLTLALQGQWASLRLFLAVVLQVTWEVVENTDRVIQHYRESTISLNYYGDSILNSLTDIAACMVGYGAAGLLPVWMSAASFAVIEIAMIAWIRDGLLLNVLMLFWPIEAVKQWQMGAAP